MRLFLVLLLSLAASMAQAANRLGLVIGNNDYANVPALEKARGDAAAVSAELLGQGFEVMTVLDASRREMNAKIAEFTDRLQPGDTALVFYAGHGVEIDGENYLLPTDIEVPTASGEDFIKYESIALSDTLQRIKATGARTTLVFLDACRDNPFEQVAGRSIGSTRGLGRIAAPEGTFIVFSAGAHQQALDALNGDDANANSVFTRLLLPKLSEPDLELRELVADLRVEVRDLARTQNHAQFPAYYDELLGEFYFTVKVEVSPGAAPGAGAPVAVIGSGSAIRDDFELARSLGTALAFRVFLEKYDGSDDLTVTLAREMLASLEANDDAAAAVTNVVPEAGPEPEPVRDPVPIPVADPRREIIRESQARLNALGCDAGGADGIVGPRTRRAFAGFINETGADLTPGDLGTPKALEALKAATGEVCTPRSRVVIREEPGSGGGAPEVVMPEAVSITGSYRYTAKCPLFITVTGTLSLRESGENRYSGAASDSLGNQGSGFFVRRGDAMNGTIKWASGVTEIVTLTFSADGQSYGATSNNGCTSRGARG